MLRGRRRECGVLDGLLDAVREGESQVLVVRGEAGVGKSALLTYLASRATGCRVACASGVQSEMELPYAGVHQLSAQMVGRLERLPVPQRDALSVAFGLSGGDAPDRFLVGLAVLSLLSDVADERPLVCLVDDAQWLDRTSAQVLAFVARRLHSEPIAFVFAVRRPGGEQLLEGLPELLVEGLHTIDARALLLSALRWPVDERVRDRIIAETGGNPLALLELPRGLTPAQLAGGFGLPDVPLPARIEDSFSRRLQGLPTETQRLLLVVAAEPIGDPGLVWRAARRLGIALEAADAAEADGLVSFGRQVAFRHPLVRSAIYRAASPQDRRDVHRALAEVTDRQFDPDRRAWHLAQASSGPDEQVASELERSASRAQARGGLAATAAFLERSVVLTPEPALRAERALAAARAMHRSGAFDGALRLLATAQAGPLRELERAQAHLLRGQIAFASSRGSDAPQLLLKAARGLEPLDARLARETYLEALSAAVYAASFATSGGLVKAAEHARAAPAASQPPGAPDLLLDGLALLIARGYAAAAPTLKRAVRAFRSGALSKEEALRWLWLACLAAARLWDDESWDLLSAQHVELAREAGALGVLPIALNARAGMYVQRGEFAAAASLIDEADAITEATGSGLRPYASVALAAFRGHEPQASEPTESSTGDAVRRDETVAPDLLHWTTAVRCNGLGRYDDALESARRAGEDRHELVFSMTVAVELIEAATRSGVGEQAASALERLLVSTRASGTDWALGVEACSRALLSDGEHAECLYREALERLARTRVRIALARAHLLYGEWLRGARRRADARDQLRIAYEMFFAMGAEGFAERAERELLATGETTRKRVAEASTQLTTQEGQVARLACDGLSNAEIGARLFISPRTVQYHLQKVFTKLGITSRTQLDRALPTESDVA